MIFTMEEQNLPQDYILFKHYLNLLEARIAQTELQKKKIDSLLFKDNGKKVEDPFVFDTGGGNLYVPKENYKSAASYLNPFRRSLFSKELGFSSISRGSFMSVILSNFVLAFGVIFWGWNIIEFITISIIEIYISTVVGLFSLGILNNFLKPVNLIKIIFYALAFMILGFLELLILGVFAGMNIDLNLPIFLPILNAISALYWAILILLINHIIFLFTLLIHKAETKIEVSDSFFDEITRRYFILQIFTFFIGLILATAPYSTNLKRLVVFIILLKTFIDVFFRLRWKSATPEVSL